jgi:phospholipid-transporting ATPase
MREAPERTFALIISGEALIRALKPEMKQDLLRLAEHCNAVLACRVSPQQKADIVKLIRDAKPKVRTLSIGDGANDVNMINAAHVGIGIAGLEGKQAVRASDYSVAQFSYLKKLMCVHGRECYRRNSNLICYNFYKNIMISMPLFFFGTLSAFSAQAFFNTWVFQFYNLFFAAIPIGFYAVFDKEMDHSELLSECKYYSLGLNGTLFKTWKFWMWIGEATIQGCLILYCSVFSLGVVPGLSSGRVSGISICSMMVFGSVVILVNVKVFVLSNTHYWFTIMTMILSAMSYLLILAFFFEILPPMQQLQNFDGYGGMSQLLGNPNTYILIVFLIYTCFYIEPLVLAAFELKHMKKEKIEIFREHELHKSDISTPLPTSELEAEEKAIARRSIAIYGRRRKFIYRYWICL